MEDLRRIMSNEDWVNMPSQDNQIAQAHLNHLAVHVWPSASAFAPVSTAHSMPGNRVSGVFNLRKNSRALSPITRKAELDDYMMVECQDELESHKMPGLKRFRTTTSTSENSNMYLGITSPASPCLSSLSTSSGLQMTEARGSILTDVEHSQSFTTSLFGQPQPPLGLALRKSPSLVELIESKLTKARKCNTIPNSQQDKLKASNFSGLLLRIGTWEFVSKHEGDLVGKFYYAKRKLVWEILDNRLKSKIEIQWSDIASLQATFQEKQPDVLEIEVSRPPLFFKEIDPQPKKHTLWQATTDFTGGQATNYKHHYLKSASGLLARHFDKLLQCDARLKKLSENAGSYGNALFSEHQSSKVKGPHEHEVHLPSHGEMCYAVRYGVPGNKCSPSFLHVQPLPESTVLGSSLAMHHSGLLPKFESIEMKSTMAEWPLTVSSSPTGQSHDDSISTDRAGFQSLKNRGGGMANYTRQTSALGVLDERLSASSQFQPPVKTEKSSASETIHSSNWKILDEISRMLLEEPYQSFPVSSGGAVSSSLEYGPYNSFQESKLL